MRTIGCLLLNIHMCVCIHNYIIICIYVIICIYAWIYDIGLCYLFAMQKISLGYCSTVPLHCYYHQPLSTLKGWQMHWIFSDTTIWLWYHLNTVISCFIHILGNLWMVLLPHFRNCFLNLRLINALRLLVFWYIFQN